MVLENGGAGGPVVAVTAVEDQLTPSAFRINGIWKKKNSCDDSVTFLSSSNLSERPNLTQKED